MSETENPNAFKHMYDEKLLDLYVTEISKVYPSFDKKEFKTILKPMLQLEMKARVILVRDKLRELLPQDYNKATDILLKSLRNGKLSGFSLWPYTEFVQTYGLDHIPESLEALKELTCLFTSEWAIRPFIKKDLKKVYAFLKKNSKDRNHHVRRWVSEGTRPRLPWGIRLDEFIHNPNLSFDLLESLKFDSELYVRKSVANHLNDLTKDHPDLVVKTLANWKTKAKKAEDIKNLEWITKHALRTLIKNGHVGALKLLGVDSKAKVKLEKLKLTKKDISMGDSVEFTFDVTSESTKDQSLVIDYIVHFMKSNGKLAPKVFKLKNVNLKPKEKLTITKRHPVKLITTRVYYPGLHCLEIQVNGKVHLKQDWKLKL